MSSFFKKNLALNEFCVAGSEGMIRPLPHQLMGGKYQVCNEGAETR